ncbi:MAG: hypothetical protein QOI73_3111, partial [Solirubrobacteraceae bacterium]|nr:hypothetical protein [Solirubrobacteraceae bacterium]
AVALHAQRDPDEVAAGGAAGRAVMGAHGLEPAPARVAQVVLEALVGHPTSLGGRRVAADAAPIVRVET